MGDGRGQSMGGRRPSCNHDCCSLLAAAGDAAGAAAARPDGGGGEDDFRHDLALSIPLWLLSVLYPASLSLHIL